MKLVWRLKASRKTLHKHPRNIFDSVKRFSKRQNRSFGAFDLFVGKIGLELDDRSNNFGVGLLLHRSRLQPGSSDEPPARVPGFKERVLSVQIEIEMGRRVVWTDHRRKADEAVGACMGSLQGRFDADVGMVGTAPFDRGIRFSDKLIFVARSVELISDVWKIKVTS